MKTWYKMGGGEYVTQKVYVLRAVLDKKAEGRIYDVQLWEGTSPYNAVQIASRVATAWDVSRTMLALVADQGVECVGPFQYLGEALPDGVSYDQICFFVPKSFARTVDEVPLEEVSVYVDPDAPEPEIEEITTFDLIDE